MLDSLTPESIYAELMMDEDQVKAFLLVEGPDEVAILFGHLANGVSSVVCGGKRNVIGAANIALAQLETPTFGLVDRDFDGVRATSPIIPSRVAQTSSYDLLSDIVHNVEHSIRRVMSAHSAGGTAMIEDRRSMPVECVVFEVGCGLAPVRLASLEEGFPLIFRDYNFSGVLDSTYKAPDASGFIEGARCKDPLFDVDAMVHSAIDRARDTLDGDVYRVGGHDIVGIIVGLLRSAGSRNISRKAIEASLITCATSRVLVGLDCISKLTDIGRTEAGIELLDLAA
ncbi:hypothetical protein [Curtobacterium poinsettiae]|uniref:hypothetical protein n=1 Tax=Curtobacterium poinsettiae TaxID=159612 RepID=UPI0023607F49|nr:hypothetical protein [Curtobacterium flaccumfaciens]MDD1385688.1 hypothetical protein [Curtobacterium flaccumfaciens pv. poinsettiae]